MPRGDQGVSRDRYMVIPRVLVFITKPGKILLIKGHPQKRLWANLYNGIGGHVEYGEDILSAANRELFEETGLSGIELSLCGNIIVDASEDIGICIFLFRGEYKAGDLVESGEGQPEWISITDIDKLPLVEDLFQIIPKILAFRHGDPPLIGHTFYDEHDQLVIQLS